MERLGALETLVRVCVRECVCVWGGGRASRRGTWPPAGDGALSESRMRGCGGQRQIRPPWRSGDTEQVLFSGTITSIAERVLVWRNNPVCRFSSVSNKPTWPDPAAGGVIKGGKQGCGPSPLQGRRLGRMPPPRRPAKDHEKPLGRRSLYVAAEARDAAIVWPLGRRSRPRVAPRLCRGGQQGRRAVVDSSPPLVDRVRIAALLS